MTSSKRGYSKRFYEGETESALRSARVMIPMLIEMLNPSSVIDFGCGTGAFLRVLKDEGILRVKGVDGPWVDHKSLMIDENEFVPFDMKSTFSSNEKYDLVICLEVAEHLPGEYSKTLVKSLTDLGDVILFSAAIPYQRGTHHINEQWPDYWAERFHEFGFDPIDCIRSKIWLNEEVDVHYAQNSILYVKKETLLKNFPNLRRCLVQDHANLAIVHPKVYLSNCSPELMNVHAWVESIPYVLDRSSVWLYRRIRRLLRIHDR